MTRVLLTRPREDSWALAETLEARGIETLVAPLLVEKVLALDLSDLAQFGGLVVTSKRAAKVFGTRRLDAQSAAIPVFAVGEATAQAMRDVGFSRVVSAQGTAQALARTVREHAPAGRILYLAGRERTPDLEAALEDAALLFETRVGYEMAAASSLPAHAASALAGADLDAVVLYSRRTAATFARLTQAGRFDSARKGLVCLVISPACAEPLAAAGFERIAVAATPDAASMEALVEGFAAGQNPA